MDVHIAVPLSKDNFDTTLKQYDIGAPRCAVLRHGMLPRRCAVACAAVLHGREEAPLPAKSAGAMLLPRLACLLSPLGPHPTCTRRPSPPLPWPQWW